MFLKCCRWLYRANILKKGEAFSAYRNKLSTIESISHWESLFDTGINSTNQAGGKSSGLIRSIEKLCFYLAILSSHLIIASMVNMEMRHATTKTIQVALMEIDL